MTSSSKPLVPEREFDPQRSARQALVAVLGFWALHSWASWGYGGIFWGEHGRWLHEIERFAGGEAPYRDFQWHFPPLALWLVGGAARVVGTSPSAVGGIMVLVFLAVALAYYRFLRQAAPAVIAPAAVTGLLFAAAYANRYPVPLPLGTTNPASPVGMTFLLIAATASLALLQQPTRRRALITGVAAGLAVLSKHDYWVAAVYAVAVGALLRPDPGVDGVRGTRKLLIGGFAATVLAGILGIIAGGGGARLLDLLLGFGYAVESMARSLPYGERLTIEVAATASMGLVGIIALWLSFALDDRRTGILFGVGLMVLLSACAIHVGRSVVLAHSLAAEGAPAMPTPLQESLWPAVAAGRTPISAAFGALDQRLQLHFFPMLLPVLLAGALAVLWDRWPDRVLRNRTLLLLGLCVALRLRRGFGGVDWYHPLVEIPAYALFLRLVAGMAARGAQRTVSAAIAILFLVGVYTYYNLGRGPLTRRAFEPVTTARGPMRWPPGEARIYRDVAALLAERDPAGTRPVFAFGPSGGWNYFLRRPNPWGITRGLLYSDVHAVSAQAGIRTHQPPPLLIDNRTLIRPTIAPRFAPFSWDPVMRPTRLAREERILFEEMTIGCTPFPADSAPVPAIVVYDCAATPPGSSP